MSDAQDKVEKASRDLDTIQRENEEAKQKSSMEKSHFKSESFGSYHQSSLSGNQSQNGIKNSNQLPNENKQQSQILTQEVEMDNKTANLLDQNASIPTIQPEMPRRGRRAGVAPTEENKEQDKVTFGGRKLGQNRLAARDPFAHLDNPSKPILQGEKKEEPNLD